MDITALEEQLQNRANELTPAEEELARSNASMWDNEAVVETRGVPSMWDEETPTAPQVSSAPINVDAAASTIAAATSVPEEKVREQLTIGVPEQVITDAHAVVTAQRSEDYKKAFDQTAAAGDTEGLASILTNFKKFVEEANANDPWMRTKQVAEVAVAKQVATNPRAANVTAETLSSTADKVAAEITTKPWYIDGEFWVKDIFVETYFRTNTLRAINKTFLGTPDWSMTEYLDTSEAISTVRNNLAGLSPTEQGALLNAFVKNAKEEGVTNDSIKGVLQRVASHSALLEAIYTFGDIAGPVADLLMVGGWIKSAGKATTKALTKGSQQVGKDMGKKLVQGDPSVADYATALSPTSILGDRLSGASPAMQATLLKDVEELTKKLSERLNSGVMYEKEVSDSLTYLKSMYDPSVNSHIRSYDVVQVADGQVSAIAIHGARDGTSFVSEEAAEAYARHRGMTKYSIVKDTGDGVVVHADVTDAYAKELKRLTDAQPAPRALAGVTYHGRARDVFDVGSSGKGEGIGAFGPGFYSSSLLEIGRKYADVAAKWQATDPKLTMYVPGKGYVKAKASELVLDHGLPQADVDAAIAKHLEQNPLSPTLFEVKISAPEKDFLEWDKVVSAKNSNKLASLGLDVDGMTGRDIWKHVRTLEGGDEKAAANALSEAGIVGMRYPAALDAPMALDTSVEGAMNYVVYPKHLNKVKVVKSTPAGEVELSGSVLNYELGNVPKSAGKIKVGTTPAEWERELESVLSRKHDNASVFDVPTGADGLTTVADGMKVSDSVGKGIQKALVTWRSMLGMDNEKLLVITKADAKKLRGKFEDVDVAHSAGKVGDAAYYKHGDTHVIITGVKANTVSGITTLGHEMGHMFHRVFKAEHGKTITKAFMKWTKENLPNGKFKATAMEATSFRTPGQVSTEGMFKEFSSSYKKWLADEDEWFAEQFAKWVTLNQKPRTEFEHLLQTLMNKVVAFAHEVADRIGLPVNKVPHYVETFLDKHLDTVKSSAAGSRTIVKEASEEAADIAETASKLDEAVVGAEDRITHGFLVREERDDVLQFNSIGGFDPKDVNSSFWVSIDPKHGASEFVMEGRVVGVFAESKLMNELNKWFIDAIKPLSKNELRGVMGALKKGDAYSNAGGVGKEFSAAELAADGLNEKQIESYFKVRTGRDIMFRMRDAEMVQSVRRQGKKNISVKFADGATYTAIGKEKQELKVGQTVYDSVSGKEVVVDQSYIDDVAAEGMVVVRFDDAHTVGGKMYRTFVASQNNSVVADVRNVLSYRPGEFSRIYTDEYFIGVRGNKIIDGASESVMDTVFTAASKREAIAFTKAMNALIAAPRETLTLADVELAVGKWVSPDDTLSAIKGGVYDGMQFEQHYNRINDEYVTSMGRAMNGTSFTGKRGQRLHSISDDAASTMTIEDSLRAEVANTARVVGRTRWKEAAIARWVAHAEKVGAIPPNLQGMPPETIWDNIGRYGFEYVGSDIDGRMLKRTHEYINMQLGAKTKQEQMWENEVRAFTERYIGKGKLEAVGKLLRNSRPGQFLRTINFHSMLGMLNPSQLIVQSMGAITAAALHPIHGLTSAKNAPLLRMALMSDNEEVWRKLATVKVFSDLGMSSADEFVDTVKAVRKTGLIENINSTSLYTLEDGSTNIFSPLARNVGKVSGWTFNRGEETARLIAFDVARKEWKDLHPGVSWNTDAALKDILVRTDDFTQNMTRANEAFIQRGVWALPTQFMQYNLKLYANILHAFGTKEHYRGFTRKEAVTIMATHIALFGVANNGFSSFIEEAVGSKATELGLSDDQRLVISQGMLAGLVDSLSEAFTGEDMELGLGSRLSTFDWYKQMATNITEKNVFEVMAGPTATTMKTAGAMMSYAAMWVQDPNLTAAKFVDDLRSLTTQQISSLRNGAKALIAQTHNNYLQTSSGDDITKMTDMEVFAQFIGMPPVEMYDRMRLKTDMKAHNEDLMSISKVIQEQMQRAVTANLEGNYELEESIKASIPALLPVNAGDKRTVMQDVARKMTSNDTYLNNLTKVMMKRPSEELPLVTVTQGDGYGE